MPPPPVPVSAMLPAPVALTFPPLPTQMPMLKLPVDKGLAVPVKVIAVGAVTRVFAPWIEMP